MAIKTSGSPVSRSERRTRTELLLESIALRHQIAVLERSRTSRPCFRCINRLLWILLSFWWPQWRESLIIVQPETVLRWRRDGWSAIWRDRSHGRWRGGRPKVSSEVRRLIVSSQCIRPVFRGTVAAICTPARSVRLVHAYAIPGCEDFDGMCWALAWPWPATARPERSKN